MSIEDLLADLQKCQQLCKELKTKCEGLLTPAEKDIPALIRYARKGRLWEVICLDAIFYKNRELYLYDILICDKLDVVKYICYSEEIDIKIIATAVNAYSDLHITKFFFEEYDIPKEAIIGCKRDCLFYKAVAIRDWELTTFLVGTFHVSKEDLFSGEQIHDNHPQVLFLAALFRDSYFAGNFIASLKINFDDVKDSLKYVTAGDGFYLTTVIMILYPESKEMLNVARKVV